MQKLQPIEIDGIVRLGGRLEKAVVKFDVKHPIILPQNCHFSELMIRQHYVEMGQQIVMKPHLGFSTGKNFGL